MTKAKILIEKNIKEPEGRITKYPFTEMEKGDSFDAGEYSTNKAKSIWGSIYHFMAKKENKKKKFSCRKTVEGTIRIWRTA